MTSARVVGAALVSWMLSAAMAAAQTAPVFVEVDGAPQRAFVHQGVPLVLRVGVDRRWLAEQAVPVLARALDRPFQVVADGLRDGETLRVTWPNAAPGLRIATGERIALWQSGGERVVEGRTFELLELRVSVTSLQPGERALPPVRVRYAFGTRFQDDMLRGRQPVDRTEGLASGPEVRWQVDALPEPAPVGFTGAVGSFEVSAVPAVAAVEVGVSLTVSLHVRGDGDRD